MDACQKMGYVGSVSADPVASEWRGQGTHLVRRGQYICFMSLMATTDESRMEGWLDPADESPLQLEFR